MRLSLGAGRARVVQQLLAESLLISIAGGALGSVLALATFPALIAWLLPALLPVGWGPFVLDASPDLRVLAFTLALMLLTGVLFGLAPALQVSKPDLHMVIKEDTPGAGSRRGARLQGTLVGVQGRSLSGTATALSGALGLLALVLAAVGIYGVASYFIGRRTREIGIRMALGAGEREVLALILKRTMRPVVVGAVTGIAAAAAASGALSGVLFGVSPFDPASIAGAALGVLGVALAAGLGPARRAARTEPTATMHHE